MKPLQTNLYFVMLGSRSRFQKCRSALIRLTKIAQTRGLFAWWLWERFRWFNRGFSALLVQPSCQGRKKRWGTFPWQQDSQEHKQPCTSPPGGGFPVIGRDQNKVEGLYIPSGLETPSNPKGGAEESSQREGLLSSGCYCHDPDLDKHQKKVGDGD